MKRIFGILFTLVLAVSLFRVPAMTSVAAEQADTVYVNGNIYTADQAFSVAQAIAIKGDRFIYVGPNEGVQAYIGCETSVVDLQGKTVVPGLIDSHLHWSPSRPSLQQSFLAVGLTGVDNANKATVANMNAWKSLYEAGTLKIRQNVMLHTDTAFAIGTPEIGLYDNRLNFRSTKVHADNELGLFRASLWEEYSDRPGFYGPWGYHQVRPEVGGEDGYAATVAALIGLGFQPRTHGIGDFTNSLLLNAYEKALTMAGKTGKEVRPVIEHSQILHRGLQPDDGRDDLPRFGQLGVIAAMQPIHATEDMPWAVSRVGPVRILGGYAWRDLLDTGAVIACSSDYSVSPYNPWYGLHAAVTRQDRNNQPPGGWYPAQRMTREEALRCYTNAGAYATFEENIKGSIEVDKLADFVVIDRDYMTCPEEEIWQIQALTTVIGGEVLYTRMTMADVDIKPGGCPNPINLMSKGVVPVAVLTTDGFDASAVDPTTVQFAGAAPVRWTLEDVDGDGDMDMLFDFMTQDLALAETSFWATLTGTTGAGVVFRGTDTVKIVPK